MKQIFFVAPFAGAWIEIINVLGSFSHLIVAPFAGAWIEIMYSLTISFTLKSLRSPERGLKFPFPSANLSQEGRSVRRSVD